MNIDAAHRAARWLTRDGCWDVACHMHAPHVASEPYGLGRSRLHSDSRPRELPLHPGLDLGRGEAPEFFVRPWEVRQRIDIGTQPVSTSTKRELRRFVPGQRERREACARARSQLLWLQAGEALAQTLVFYPQTADYLSITPWVGIARHVQTVALHRLLCDAASRTTGMRSCNSAISAFGAVVRMVNERVTVSSGQRYLSHSPANAFGWPSLGWQSLLCRRLSGVGSNRKRNTNANGRWLSLRLVAIFGFCCSSLSGDLSLQDVPESIRRTLHGFGVRAARER